MLQATGFCVLLIACSFSEAAAAGRDGKKNETFDSLMLTREWPFSFCSVKSCRHKELLQKKFNIHGLWPDVANASSSEEPMFCNVTFNESDLKPLLPELNENWIDLTNPNGSAMGFWREEFKKHGSCVVGDSKYNTTFLYFQTALKLHAKYNLMDMLAKGGVKPGPSPIDASKIRAALHDSFGFDAEVRCAKESNAVYLYELRLCFTKDLQPMDCEVKLPKAVAAATVATDGDARRRQPQTLELLPSPLQCLLSGAERLLRRIFWQQHQDQHQQQHQEQYQEQSSVRGTVSETDTYECPKGEMVLLPEATAGL